MTRRCRWIGAAAALLLLVPIGALAGDRPFIATSTALVEDDDDGTLGLELWGEFGRAGGLRTREWRAQAEYNFNPWTSLQLELGWARQRSDGDVARERSVELEFKRIWLQQARDGVGLGVAAGVEWERADGGGWRRSAQWIYAPMSWRLPDAEGHVHANLGAERRVDDSTRLRWALGAEHELARRTVGFVEAGGLAGTERLLHAGVRQWIKRDKFAVDAGIARRISRDDGERHNQRVIALGIAIYDIGW